jgi:ADP-ribosylglycohydrolase
MIAGAYYGPTQIPKRWATKIDSQLKKRCEKQTQELLKLAAELPTPH